MARLPPSANTHVNEQGLIYGDDFNDSYFSRDDGLEESRTVFLKGCGLPEAWSTRSSFVIGELGFGTGLNVLATWALWNQTRQSDAILHIVTVEGFLLDSPQAQAAHQMWPQLQALSDQLIAKWPTRAFGAQRIWFPGDGLCITFLIGPCEEALASMDFEADCWFLDGFSPARNPDMWSPAVFAQIARLSAPGARFGTYSVAGAVRAGLNEVGFEVARVPGFGTKRQRLEGRFKGNAKVQPKRPQSAIVIGGGIAGACVGAALIKRGLHVDLFDADPCGRTKASANPLALIMPRLDRGDTNEAQFFRASYLMALSNYHAMAQGFDNIGVTELGIDEPTFARLTNLGEYPPFPPDHITRPDDQSLTHVQGGLVYPDLVLKHLSQGVSRHPVAIDRLAQIDGIWHAFDAAGAVLATADMCVLANGPAANQFCDLNFHLRGRAGQLSWAQVKGTIPSKPVSGGAYCAPFGDRLVFGATYKPVTLDATPPPVSLDAHIYNRDALALIKPELACTIDLETASGRTAIRATTPDQLPIAGVIDGEGVGKYIVAGLGSRGFTTAFLCAEIVASLACHEPSPVESKIALALSPDRFHKRAVRRKQV
jgi:tRNA 5-methylaminomethyl-2-thiouridine biosynthesis bifunctional protein